MELKEYLKNNLVYLDGGFGTLLQSRGLSAGELPERRNLTHPDLIKGIHLDYYNAGANIVHANTFGANILKFSESELESIISSAAKIANDAKKESIGTQEKWVALDLGPTGRMLKPYGDLDFESAVEIFAKTVRIGAKYGFDLVSIETMNDSYETKAALLAAKENCSLPVFVSNAYSADGKLVTGASPAAMVAMLEGLGADAIGLNCSLGPKALKGILDEYLKNSSLPVILKPNAGLPKIVNGKTVFDVDAEEFSTDMAEAVRLGARIVGGCCGTTPEYISALKEKTSDIKPVPVEKKEFTLVSSYTHAQIFDREP
ncbi:MAG: homocysteine methyltransferase, partial [Ruminococcaceae bacterium]|nr:homocysteine methyltransferase [Oscillospiraceae bacterium]